MSPAVKPGFMGNIFPVEGYIILGKGERPSPGGADAFLFAAFGEI